MPEIKPLIRPLAAPLIVGIALIVAALAFGGCYFFAQSANSKDTLAVTGSAKTRVTSDQAKLVISLNRIAPATDLKTGYAEIAGDLKLTEALLKKNGMSGPTVLVSPVSMNQFYDGNSGLPLRYQLYQTVTVQSDDVAKITAVSEQVPELAAQGAIVSVQSREYYYSKLPDLRVSLLTQAVQDAKARAEKIAEGTGRSVGSVQAASSGVVQVLAPDSVDVSDYGSYDTASVDKDIMVTVKASFRLK